MHRRRASTIDRANRRPASSLKPDWTAQLQVALTTQPPGQFRSYDAPLFSAFLTSFAFAIMKPASLATAMN